MNNTEMKQIASHSVGNYVRMRGENLPNSKSLRCNGVNLFLQTLI